jgi:hypothetical protein
MVSAESFMYFHVFGSPGSFSRSASDPNETPTRQVGFIDRQDHAVKPIAQWVICLFGGQCFKQTLSYIAANKECIDAGRVAPGQYIPLVAGEMSERAQRRPCGKQIVS